MITLPKKKILGVDITDATENEILEYILQGLPKKEKNYYIVTPNPEILVFSHHHPAFKTVLNNARLALPDGTGVLWAGKFEAKSFKERIAGTDFMEKLCRQISKRPITVGFLGGRGKVAELTAECLQKKYPGLKVVFTGSEWPQREKVSHGARKVSKVSKGKTPSDTSDTSVYPFDTQIDILFVAYGFPKQEEWMSENLSSNNYKVAIGVGGAFDYISGRVPRAPKWVQNIGFEWLFRLIIQPWRLKRQLALLEFVFLVLREKSTKS